MSRFFRSSADSDSESTSSDSSSEDDNDIDDVSIGPASNDDSTVGNDHPLGEASTGVRALTIAGTLPSAAQPKDMLLHALLEERCIAEARNELRRSGMGHDEPAVTALAQRKYSHLVSQLTPYGLVLPGLDADVHRATRQHYRDGLNLLSQSSTAPNLSSQDQPVTVSAQTRRLLTGPEPVPAVTRDFLAGLQQAQILHNLPSLPPSVTSMVPISASLNGNRYRQDFDEIGILGKGGYGIVYHVQHKLDGVPYAIKKVPLSSARLQKIHLRGQKEVDELLTELRTLAKLEHPNIVRYYSGWVEWTSFGHTSSGAGHVPHLRYLNGQWTEVVDDSRSGFTVERIQTASASDEEQVIFENSTTRSEGSINSDSPSGNVQIHRIRNRTAAHSGGIESISREVAIRPEPSNSTFLPSNTTDSVFPASGEPTLALHMQMALYPMTLADFITSSQSQPSHEAAPLTHCFHVEPSIWIMLSILEGVEYLHSEGIVHRDLKPGNIFIGFNQSQRNARGCVDLALCEDCIKQGRKSAPSLSIRIGDFGLVTDIANPEAKEANATYDAVGTEIYRPSQALSTANAVEKLDVFALGIVLFELLYKFETRMERLETLKSLKQCHFPAGFVAQRKMDVVTACIADMLSVRLGNDCSIRQIKSRLSCLL